MQALETIFPETQIQYTFYQATMADLLRLVPMVAQVALESEQIQLNLGILTLRH